MTGTEPLRTCPSCGKPLPSPLPALCPSCQYPLIFIDQTSPQEGEARGLRKPTPPEPEPEPEPTPEPEPEPREVATVTCPVCGLANAPERTWCEQCGTTLVTAPEPVPEPPPPPPPPVSQVPEWLRKAWVPLALVAAVGLGLGGWYLWSAAQPGPGPGPGPTASASAPGPGVVPNESITVVASSTLPPTRNQAFDAALTIDGNPATAWQSDGATDGDNPVTLRWEFASPVQLSGIEVHNGYQLDDTRFYENARPDQVTVTTEAGEQEVSLEDRQGAQEIAVEATTSFVEFTILSAHRDQAEFPDLALSEVTFLGTPQ